MILFSTADCKFKAYKQYKQDRLGTNLHSLGHLLSLDL